MTHRVTYEVTYGARDASHVRHTRHTRDRTTHGTENGRRTP